MGECGWTSASRESGNQKVTQRLLFGDADLWGVLWAKAQLLKEQAENKFHYITSVLSVWKGTSLNVSRGLLAYVYFSYIS